MIDIVCEICGSNKLEFDATAVWNVVSQEFQYENCDSVWCTICEDTVSVKEVEIEDSFKGRNINNYPFEHEV